MGGGSSSLFNGHCDGGNGVSPQNISVKLGDNTNVGSEIKNQNNPSITVAEQINLSKCSYTPTSTNVGLPNVSQSRLAKMYNANQFVLNNLTVNKSCNQIPRGLIIAWFGANIPDGWALCDGTNCTPDLRGRAILGFDSTSNKNKIGQYGGEENHLLTIGEIPTHTHKYSINRNPAGFLTSASGTGKSGFGAKTTNASGSNSYLNQTTNSPHNNMPPFVVCSYIMKL